MEVGLSWKGGKAVTGTPRPGVAGEFARVQSGGQAVRSAESDGVWKFRLRPRREYAIILQ
jgi:hypothetical protein